MLACSVFLGISQSIGGVTACLTFCFALFCFFAFTLSTFGASASSALTLGASGVLAFVCTVFFSETAATISFKLAELVDALLGPVDACTVEPSLGILGFLFLLVACEGGGD